MKKIIIIGAGVVGCAAARNLSRYNFDVKIIEKAEDVSTGATKANSGIVHAGYAAKSGSLKGLLCVRGNRMYGRLDRELNFGYRQCGSLVLAFSGKDEEIIKQLYDNGIRNRVENLQIIDRPRILELEAGINPEVRTALYAPTAGVASPYEFAIALAENSIANGTELFLNSCVTGIKKEKAGYLVRTTKGDFRADYVLNAAGVYSDRIAEMIGDKFFEILPRKGQYIIFDRWTGNDVSHVLFRTPAEKGKGILVTSTYHNNLMLGPDAEAPGSRTDLSTDRSTLKYILETAALSYSSFDSKKIIRTFAGIRATSSTGDFVINNNVYPDFINVAGIDSPGLTSAPAIATMVENIMRKTGLTFEQKTDFDPVRKGIITKRENLPAEEVESLIKLPSSPEKMICRCEQVREAVIKDSLHRGIRVLSLDGVKRRTRAGMGRCQGAFCGERVRNLVAREYGVAPEDIKERGKGSRLLDDREDGRFYRE